jgi:hypothetical protein
MGTFLRFNLSIYFTLLISTASFAAHVEGEESPPEVKLALLGDTAAGTGLASVLKLVAAEGTDVVMINGDLGYDATAEQWKAQVEASIDTSKFAVIGSLGNHDVGSKDKYIEAFSAFRNSNQSLKTSCTGAKPISEGHDIIAVDETCTFGNITIIPSGIGQVLTKAYLEGRLENKLRATPVNNWKLVGYHFTLASMNPGIKREENTPKFFELIRKAGAIGVQAHTHSVMASCPISSSFTAGTTVTCHSNFQTDLESRFVAPGIGMYMDSSISGKAVRNRTRCLNPKENGCTHMVDLITTEGYTRTDGTTNQNFNRFGALFVVFNSGGDPSKALVYYKSIDGQVIFKFTIAR